MPHAYREGSFFVLIIIVMPISFSFEHDYVHSQNCTGSVSKRDPTESAILGDTDRRTTQGTGKYYTVYTA